MHRRLPMASGEVWGAKMPNMLNVGRGKPAVASRGVVVCAAYTNGRRVAELSLQEIGPVLRDGNSFVWVGMYEPDKMLLDAAQREFDLHDLAIEDAQQAHQRPKLEQYEGSLFVVVRTAQLTREAQGRPGVEFGE